MSGLISLPVSRVMAVLTATLLVSCAGKVSDRPPPSTANINAYVEELVLLNDVPGLAVAAIQNGRVIFENYYGVAALDTREPVTSDTVFRIYSTSKLMTAVIVFQLVEHGKLELDAPISRFFSNFPTDWNDVTVGHLLAHASGLPDVRGLVDEMSDDSLSDEDFFKLIFPLERQYSTGEGWSYNQTNYLLLKRIIEQVTGESFEQYLREQAFSHVALNRTIFSSNDIETIPNRAKNYRYTMEAGTHKQKLENYGKRNNVLAGLNLTLKELIDWNQDFDTGKFVAPETQSLMWTQFPYKNPDEKFLYGWGVYPVADQTSFGFTGGGVTGLRKFPDHNLTIVVLSNGYKYYPVHNTVINHVAGMLVPALENKPVALARMYQHAFLRDGSLDVTTLYDRTEENQMAVNAEEVMTSFAYKLLDIGESQHALSVFEEITQRKPRSFAAFENLGHAHLGQGSIAQALAAFEAARNLQPENSNTQKMIEEIKQRLK